MVGFRRIFLNEEKEWKIITAITSNSTKCLLWGVQPNALYALSYLIFSTRWHVLLFTPFFRQENSCTAHSVTEAEVQPRQRWQSPSPSLLYHTASQYEGSHRWWSRRPGPRGVDHNFIANTLPRLLMIPISAKPSNWTRGIPLLKLWGPDGPEGIGKYEFQLKWRRSRPTRTCNL